MSDKETPWTDDPIRWEEDEAADEQESGEDHHQQAAALLDPFKNPDPTETFSRQYALPASGEFAFGSGFRIWKWLSGLLFSEKDESEDDEASALTSGL